MVNEAQNPATGGIPKTHGEYREWMTVSAATGLNDEQWAQAGVVKMTFDTLALNKNNPAAFERAKKMHDREMAKLEAMFVPPLSE